MQLRLAMAKRNKTIYNIDVACAAWAHQFNRENEFDSPAPHVYEERCTGCGICLQSCAFDAIRFERREGRRARVLVITENCIGCNACIGTCPPELNAIEVRYGKT